jgi:hypothetical protein
VSQRKYLPAAGDSFFRKICGDKVLQSHRQNRICQREKLGKNGGQSWSPSHNLNIWKVVISLISSQTVEVDFPVIKVRRR